MSWQDTFRGALTLKTATFAALRERSDVFRRGFLILLIAGLIAGAFGSLPSAIDTVTPLRSEEQVVAQASDFFQRSLNGPSALGEMLNEYATGIARMVYQVRHLEPRAGVGARPVAALIQYLVSVVQTPFSFAFAGSMLFLGLLVQLSSRLLGGRASMAQMLGLTALAAAPQVFSTVASLFTLIATISGVGLLNSASSLVGLIVFVWSTAVYVKATSVAQRFSGLHAFGALVLGFVIFFGVIFLVIIALVILTVLFLIPVTRVTQPR